MINTSPSRSGNCGEEYTDSGSELNAGEKASMMRLGEADQHASDSNVPYTILQMLAGSGDGVNVGWRLQGLNVIRLLGPLSVECKASWTS